MLQLKEGWDLTRSLPVWCCGEQPRGRFSNMILWGFPLKCRTSCIGPVSSIFPLSPARTRASEAWLHFGSHLDEPSGFNPSKFTFLTNNYSERNSACGHMATLAKALTPEKVPLPEFKATRKKFLWCQAWVGVCQVAATLLAL